MARTIERFPLFPLGLVLLPQELVPLHIFEDRYKQMIGECLDEQSEFGIIWLSDDGLKETGCSARISRVLERFEDGRLNILVQGTEPFRLLRKIEDLPYPAGDIEVVDDDDSGDDEAADTARRRYADLVEELTESRPEDEALAQLDAYGMAATLDVEPARKAGAAGAALGARPVGTARHTVRRGARAHPPGRVRRRAGARERAPADVGSSAQGAGRWTKYTERCGC